MRPLVYQWSCHSGGADAHAALVIFQGLLRVTNGLFYPEDSVLYCRTERYSASTADEVEFKKKRKKSSFPFRRI